MARFILDFMINDSQEGNGQELIEKVLDVIERDGLLAEGVTSIRCIDTTNNNQFYSHDRYYVDDKLVVTSPMMNKLSKKQIEEHNRILSTY